MTGPTENLNLLGLVLARRGSVRLPNKNGRDFAGRTLVGIAVGQALQAKSLQRVGLSTDSRAYIDLAREAGLAEDYVRPDHLAGPDVQSADCVLDYVDWLAAEKNFNPTHIVLLQPTSPFRTAQGIDDAVETWRESEKQSLVSVTPPGHKPEFVVSRDNGKIRQPYLETGTEHYVLNGAIFITPLRMLRDTGRFWDEDSALFINRFPCAFDIDTEDDFAVAEAVYCARAKG